MKFKSLEVEYEGYIKQFEFEGKNLIHSDSNSVGKSTLLRLLFFSLGYAVPGTKKFKFTKCRTKLIFEKNGETFFLDRENQVMLVKTSEALKYQFLLPAEELQLFSLVWGSENEGILKNILGAIYFDQEKGWTLLNRGKVIGNIRFNIEELIRGMSYKDVSNLLAEKSLLESETKKYNHLKNILEYKNSLTEQKNSNLYVNHLEELYALLDEENIERKEIEKRIASLKKASRDNETFLNYIENMKITVKDSETGRVIPVSKSTIEYFDENQEYLHTRLKIEQIDLSKINISIDKIKLKIDEQGAQMNLKTEIERFNEKVMDFNFDTNRVERILDELRVRKTTVDSLIKKSTYSNNELIVSIKEDIERYLSRLNASEYVDSNSNFLFTSDIKSLSGAVLHKLVFSYKMAYIKALENILGLKLPIILDSPSGRELDPINLEETFKILNDDFSGNQIIIASIFKENLIEGTRIIEINQNLMENAESILGKI